LSISEKLQPSNIPKHSKALGKKRTHKKLRKPLKNLSSLRTLPKTKSKIKKDAADHFPSNI
jgi:hypothetical protein